MQAPTEAQAWATNCIGAGWGGTSEVERSQAAHARTRTRTRASNTHALVLAHDTLAHSVRMYR